MATYGVHLDLEWALSTPQRCPGCDAPELEAVSDGDQTNFQCRSCGQCWHIALGWVSSTEQRGCLPADDRAELPSATAEAAYPRWTR